MCAPTLYLRLLEADPQRELDLAGGICRAGTFAKSPAYPRSTRPVEGTHGPPCARRPKIGPVENVEELGSERHHCAFAWSKRKILHQRDVGDKPTRTLEGAPCQIADITCRLN